MHGPEADLAEPHTDWHEHEPMTHAHSHHPDIHHRHDHAWHDEEPSTEQ